MAEKLGPAFAVSRIGAATKYGGTTYTLKAHFHTRDHAETVRRLLEEQPLPPGPFPEQAAAQAESIDLDKLRRALVWHGYAPPTHEMLGWWVGREVNRLLDLVLRAKDDLEAERRTRSVTVALASGQPRPPCTVCGTAEERHGSFPTCAAHPYTPDGNCGYVVGAACVGAECKARCVRASGGMDRSHG